MVQAATGQAFAPFAPNPRQNGLAKTSTSRSLHDQSERAERHQKSNGRKDDPGDGEQPGSDTLAAAHAGVFRSGRVIEDIDRVADLLRPPTDRIGDERTTCRSAAVKSIV